MVSNVTLVALVALCCASAYAEPWGTECWHAIGQLSTEATKAHDAIMALQYKMLQNYIIGADDRVESICGENDESETFKQCVATVWIEYRAQIQETVKQAASSVAAEVDSVVNNFASKCV